MFLITSALLSLSAIAANPPAKPADPPVALTVRVPSQQPKAFTAEELTKLEHVTLTTGEGEDRQVYAGVPLATILEAAGMEWGTKCSRWNNCYVLVGAADKYRVAFSISEIDPRQAHKAVLLADRCNDNPLPEDKGPYQMIVEDAKQQGRCIRQVIEIQVREIPE